MKLSKILIFCGAVCFVAAIVLTAYNFYTDYSASNVAAQVLVEIDKAVEISESEPVVEEQPAYILNPKMEMPLSVVDGKEYIGILEIPALDKKLPVMNNWSYSNFKISPCRYNGSVYLNNFVIAAHNYTSHFRNIKNLVAGDKVKFTDVDGNVFNYQVVETEIIQPTEIERMVEHECDLTFFTCTIGGKSRVAVRCNLISE